MHGGEETHRCMAVEGSLSTSSSSDSSAAASALVEGLSEGRMMRQWCPARSMTAAGSSADMSDGATGTCKRRCFGVGAREPRTGGLLSFAGRGL